MRRGWWIGLTGLVAAIALAMLLESDERSARAPRADATVTVSLDQPARTRGSMNGFIHSLDETLPASDRVSSLAPRLWRSDGLRAPVDRALGFGAEYQLVLSDLWGYPQSDWSGRGPPWENLEAWEGLVRDTARAFRRRPVSWDIWNEPNDPGFWNGGRRRFFEVYATANRALREELGPGVRIAGPSVSRFAPRRLEAFLERCLAERCRVHSLSWHENLEPTDPVDSISGHLEEARRRFLDNDRFAPLGLREIHVNEYVGRSDRYLPGEAVAYLAQLERGGADRAARSCWSEEDCGPSGLDGLLTPDGTPRSVWWAHRWYAQGAEDRVRSDSGDTSVPVLATADERRAQVLLGNAPRLVAQDAAGSLRMRLSLRGDLLAGASRVRVRAETVPGNAGPAPVPTPRRALEREYSPSEDALSLVLPPLAPHDAMRVVIEPAEG